MNIADREVTLLKLLGKGKSGYSWLADTDDGPVVLKALHDEPNPYYQFNKGKMEHELEAYRVLRSIGIPVPALIDIDREQDCILKQYIPGTVAACAVAEERTGPDTLQQLANMFNTSRIRGYNLDYFPMNFVITAKGRLVYIDYEINPYTEEWDLWNWGIYYWLNTKGMARFLETDDPCHINVQAGSGIPIKAGLEERVRELRKRIEAGTVKEYGE